MGPYRPYIILYHAQPSLSAHMHACILLYIEMNLLSFMPLGMYLGGMDRRSLLTGSAWYNNSCWLDIGVEFAHFAGVRNGRPHPANIGES